MTFYRTRTLIVRTLSQNFMNAVLPTLSILFRVHEREYWGALTCRLMANLNETTLGLSASQIRSPKKILTRQWHHVAGFYSILLISAPAHHTSYLLYLQACLSIWNLQDRAQLSNKQSDSGPIPTWLLKQCSSVLTPIIIVYYATKAAQTS